MCLHYCTLINAHQVDDGQCYIGLQHGCHCRQVWQLISGECVFILHVDGWGYIVHTQIRLPPDTSDEVDEDPTGTRTIWDRGWLSGAAQKVLSTYHTVTPHGTWLHGDIV